MTNYPDSQQPEAGGLQRSRRSKSGRQPKEPRQKKESRELPRWAAELWDWGRTLVIALIVVVLLHFFVFNLSTVEGQSMEPTLYEDEWLFVNKISYFIGDPKLGDVIILKDPTGRDPKKEFLVKRIVGMPGDTIEVKSGELYRNGEHIIEAYTDTVIEDLDYGPYTIEAGKYFVMGDNRHARASLDSRAFGTVDRDLIQGRADFILWPITKLDAL
ncbi:signal peptidase I [Paenibacillus phyllosphaerae]|uniref:Signal peptidase I n=1 Tax=Paenibacillus phyllosphaerae TaxID=274593 RepID=A0A7W5FQ33_9BACL|nr:signal peptidase I [Paenibacillus phyllosphaerae]MBB3112619.1 signal peptidase I [Paenibacillus phyllosphaerae]